MTRKDIENYEDEKIKSLDDFVAFCCYHDSDFGYQWDTEYVWDEKHYRHLETGNKLLNIYIPFDKLDLFTEKVIGFDYFDDRNYPEVHLYWGGICFDDQDEIKDLMDYFDIKDAHDVFPDSEEFLTRDDLSTEEGIDKYFKHLEEVNIREKGSNNFIE